MAFCRNCGAELEDGVKFCTNCGAPVAAEEAPKNGETKTEQPTKAAPAGEKSGWEKFCDTPGITDEIDEKDAKDNVGMGVLAYLFWLCLIPKFARKDSKFCQYHATQGMFLAIIETALMVISIIFDILPRIPFLTGLIGFIVWIAELGCTFFAVVGIINVVQGKARELPIIGKYNFLNKK